MFPDGEFVLRNRASGRVADVAYNSTEAGGTVITYDLKTDEDNSNQRWRFEDGQLINVNSGLALTFNDIAEWAGVTQEHPEGSGTQRFYGEDGIIWLADDGDRAYAVADVDGNIQLAPRNDDDENQRWDV